MVPTTISIFSSGLKQGRLHDSPCRGRLGRGRGSDDLGRGSNDLGKGMLKYKLLNR